MYTIVGKKRLRVYQTGDKFFVYKRLKEPILAKNVIYAVSPPKRRNKSKEIIDELEYRIAGEKQKYEKTIREYENKYRDMLKKTKETDPKSVAVIKELTRIIDEQKENASQCEILRSQAESRQSFSPISQDEHQSFSHGDDEQELSSLQSEMSELRKEYAVKENQLKSINAEFKAFVDNNIIKIQETNLHIQQLEATCNKDKSILTDEYNRKEKSWRSQVDECSLREQLCKNSLVEDHNAQEHVWTIRYTALQQQSNELTQMVHTMTESSNTIQKVKSRHEKDLEAEKSTWRRMVEKLTEEKAIVSEQNSQNEELNIQIRNENRKFLEKLKKIETDSDNAKKIVESETKKLQKAMDELIEKNELVEEDKDSINRNLQELKKVNLHHIDNIGKIEKEFSEQLVHIQNINEENEKYKLQSQEEIQKLKNNIESILSDNSKNIEEQRRLVAIERENYNTKIKQVEAQYIENLNALKSENAKLLIEKTQVESTLQRVKEAIDKLQRKYNLAATLADEYKRRMRELGEQEDQKDLKEQLTKKLGDTVAEMIQNKQRLIELEAENEELKNTSGVQEINYGNLNTEYDKLTKENERHMSESRQWQAKHTEVKKEVLVFKDLVENLEFKLEQTSKEHKQISTSFQAQIETLLTKIQELESLKLSDFNQIEDSKNQIMSTIKQLQENKTECEKILADNVELESLNSELTKNLRHMQVMLSEYHDQAENASQMAKDALADQPDKNDFKTLQATVAKLRKELENAQEEREQCEEYATKNVQLERENSILRQKLENN